MLLDMIDEPRQLHRMTRSQLVRLCRELRERIIDTVGKTGGHLASNLGVVELTVALHSILNTPRDKLIWDVGHQAYAHKLLTGRRDAFGTLRQYRGISGFPARHESIYDPFTVGHSSTSISAALGYALARDQRQEDYNVVAVVGDGALTAGMAFEALNHAGHLDTQLLVILNDNEMSIAPNVGALSQYLTKLRTDPTLSRTREEMEQLLGRLPAIGDSMLRVTDRMKKLVKQLVVPGMLFEELGFTYVGPIDGHDVALMQKVFRDGLRRKEPVLIHVITQKGKGYGPSEANPELYHGTGPLETLKSAQSQLPSYSQVFGEKLSALAQENDKIVAVTAAMPDGTGLSQFKEHWPDRFFDVGIAEQHAVTLAAGLAAGGLRPVVAIYSTFLQRSFDQIIHDVCLPQLPVVLAVDRAGLVGEDGPTHHGVFDLSYLRMIPNLKVMAPKDSRELSKMLELAFALDGCVAIRYPRGPVHDEILRQLGAADYQPIELGKAEVLSQGSDITIVAIGAMVTVALEVAMALRARGLDVGVINARFIKPLDEETLLNVAEKTDYLITLEENVLAGGFGSAVLELLEAQGLLQQVKVKRIGVPDVFVEHGDNGSLYRALGLDVGQLVERILLTTGQRKEMYTYGKVREHS
ncbi:MAG: 1-deoxy-D-xylulose-5-phosphate synthase [Firmicutes bacterium]|nr:1-deoxy-D-xylulose-5-phosphate synthase [Bacillota bacterium]